MPTNFYPPFESDQFYHVYNQGNSGTKIFYNNRNYEYFLSKYHQYLGGIIDTYVYCLIPNHFHFLVKIKNEDEVLSNLNKFKFSQKFIASLKNIDRRASVSQIVSEMFRRFFMSYSKSINEQLYRKGSLFSKNVKRKLIDNDDYLLKVVYYIHSNPEHHKIIDDFRKYSFSSYNEIISGLTTNVNIDSTISLFQDFENFIYFHDQQNGIEKKNLLDE